MSDRTHLTLFEASVTYAVSTHVLRTAIRRGELRADKLPGHAGPYLVERADVARWLATRKVPA